MKGETAIIPRTYQELQQQYGKYVYNLLNKHNKVGHNLEDLHGYIWVKILEAEVLERFEDHVKKQVPRVLTAFQATELLGVSWREWAKAMYEAHVKGWRWMPTPINQAEYETRGAQAWNARDALFSLIDVLQLTIGIKQPFETMGHHVQDGEVIGGERPEGYLKFPETKATPSQFKNYLTMAVLNHFANFCRTLDRRHKERPQQARVGADTVLWESTVVDTSNSSPETLATVNQVCDIITGTLESHLGSCPETNELVVSRLKDGSSLMSALREADLSPKIRKAVIKALRPLMDKNH